MSVFLVSIFAIGAEAGVTAMLKDNEFLKWIFYDMAEGLVQSPPAVQALILARVLIGILVLSILFGVTQMLFPNFSKNSRMGISIAIGLIAAAAIPQAMLIGIYATWSGLIAIAMIGTPVIGIFYLTYTQFAEPKRANYFAKFILMLIAAWVTSVGAVTDPTTVAASAPGWAKLLGEYFQSVLGWMSLIIWFSLVYYLYKTVSPGGAALDTAAAKIGGKGLSWIDRKTRGAVRRLSRYDFGAINYDKIAADIMVEKGKYNAAGATLYKKNAAVQKARKIIKKASSTENRIEGYEEYIYSIVRHLEDEALKEELEKDIKEMIAADQKVDEEVDSAIRQIGAATPNFDDAKNHIKAAKTKSKMSERAFLKLRGKLKGNNLAG